MTSGAGVGVVSCCLLGVFPSASRAATCTARQGVGPDPLPGSLVSECSIPATKNVARHARSKTVRTWLDSWTGLGHRERR